MTTLDTAASPNAPAPPVDRDERASRLLWAVGIAAAVAIGVLAQRAPTALLAAGGAAAAIAYVVVCARYPRAGLVLLLFLLVAYVPDAVGQKLGLPFSSQAGIAVLVVVVLAQPQLRRELQFLRAEGIAFAAVVATMVLAGVFASDRAIAISRIADQLKDTILVFLILVLIDRAAWLRRAMWAFGLGGVALAFVTVVQQATHAYQSDFGGFAVTLPYLSTHRSEGPLSANYFAQMLVISAVLLLYVSCNRAGAGAGSSTRPDDTARWRRYAVGVGGASLCAVAVVFTLSRGAVLAVVAALVAVGILRRWRRLAVVAVLVALLSTVALPSQFKDRIAALSTPTSNAVDLSAHNRLGENLAAVQMFAFHPLVGVGPGNFDGHYLEYSQYIGIDARSVPRQPHDLYLEVLSERGLIGAVAFAWLMVMVTKGALIARRSPSDETAALAEASFVALVALFVTGLFLHGAYPRYLWITVGFALAARRVAARAGAA